MKNELLPNPFLHAAEAANTNEEKSGIRKREPAPQQLEPSESYVSPVEANAYIAKRTQDLDKKLDGASPEERGAIQNELGALRKFKREIDRSVKEQGEDALVENPYFGGAVEFGHGQDLTKDQASKLLDRAVAEREEAMKVRDEVMGRLRRMDERAFGAQIYAEGLKGIEGEEAEQERAEGSARWHAKLAQKSKSESQIGDALRESLDALDEAESRVAKYEKLVSLTALREALMVRREAIMKELRQIDELHETAAAQARELHASAAKRPEEAGLYRQQVAIQEAAATNESRKPSDEELFASMAGSIHEAQARDRMEEHARRLESVSRATTAFAESTQDPRHARIAELDRKSAEKAKERADMAEANLGVNDAIRRDRLYTRPVSEKEKMQAAAKAAEGLYEADLIEEEGRVESARGASLENQARRIEQKAKLRKQELAESLSHVMDQIDSVDHRLDDLGPIEETEEPSIQPHEKRLAKRANGKNSRRAA